MVKQSNVPWFHALGKDTWSSPQILKCTTVSLYKSTQETAATTQTAHMIVLFSVDELITLLNYLSAEGAACSGRPATQD